MDSAQTACINYEYKGQNHCIYSVEIKQNESKIDIIVKNENSIMLGKFKISLSLEEFQKLNKYYKQFDTIDEIYQDLLSIENFNELTSIELDKNFIKFSLTLKNIPEINPNKHIELMIKAEKISENDILFNLCEKVKEIDVLKRKNDYLFFLLGKTEKDFEYYESAIGLFSFNSNKKIIDSKIIKLDDLVVIQKGILKKLNKKIKDIKLLYRASRDGNDNGKFHSKCDGKINTVTFVKSKNGRRFGGFSEKAWNSSNKNYVDNNAFLFSLDSKEYYFYKGSTCMSSQSSNGPVWGDGRDLGLYENSGKTKQTNSFEYNGKVNCLSGGIEFQTDEYETYQLIFE